MKSLKNSRLFESLELYYGLHQKGYMPYARGFGLTGLDSDAFYKDKISWVDKIEENFLEIKTELFEYLKQNSTYDEYKYKGFSEGKWESIFLVKNGSITDKKIFFPKTLKNLKLICPELFFREAMFSILNPRTKILPHRDSSNIFLTFHLGITIPTSCGIKVNNIEKTWTEGKSIIFDTSFVHEAWNNSNEKRIVLLVDFFNPKLNDAEIAFFKKNNYLF